MAGKHPKGRRAKIEKPKKPKLKIRELKPNIHTYEYDHNGNTRHVLCVGNLVDAKYHQGKSLAVVGHVEHYGSLGTLEFSFKNKGSFANESDIEPHTREFLKKNPGIYLAGVRSHFTGIGELMIRHLERIALKEKKKYILAFPNLKSKPLLLKLGYKQIGSELDTMIKNIIGISKFK